MAVTGDGLEETFNRIAEAVGRRKRAFVVVALTVFLAIQALAFFWPGKFAARAALLIQSNRLTPQLNTNPQDPPTIITGGVTEEDVNSEIAILTSNDVLTRTVESTGLGLVPPPWYLRLLFAPLRGYERLYAWYHELPYASDVDRAPEGLLRSVTAERLKDSDVLVVEYRAGDPEFAEIVLGELIKHYLERHVTAHTSLQAEPFFGSQAALLEDELRRLETELADLQLAIGAVDVEAEQSIQLGIDGGLREEAALVGRRIAELSATIAEYDRIVADATESGRVLGTAPQRDSILDDLKAQALRLELEQIDLESRYASDFPLVEENERKLEATRRALELERRNVRDHSPTLAQVDMERARAEAEKAGLEERRVVLDEQVAASRERLMELERTAMEIDRVRRRIRTVEERYTSYLSRSEQARVDAELDQRQVTNVTVVQQPVASLRPVRPKKSIVLLVSVLGGALAGLLAGLWLEIRQVGLAAVLAALAAGEARS
ncbi:MAG: hypothetical protein MUC56_12630 [Thermoanaerobaculales bacterium]|nr:hypothetical protein [Thermoanaerobaculales bacterium]